MSDKAKSPPPELNRIKVPLKSIHADVDWNVRVNSDKIQQDESSTQSGEDLVDSLSRNGLENPLTVMKTPDDGYKLVAGFRRYAAAKKLGWDLIDVSVLPEGSTMADARKHNLIENYHRKNLTTYELARGFTLLRDENKMSGKQVVAMMNLDMAKSTVNQWMNIYDRLCEPLKKTWANPKDGANKICTFNNLLDVIAFKSEAEQMAAFATKQGVRAVTSGGKKGEGKDENEKGKPVKKVKPETLKAALQAMRSYPGNLSESWIDGCEAALEFALGKKTKLLAGTKVIFDAVKAVKDAKEKAKKAVKEAAAKAKAQAKAKEEEEAA